MTGQIGGAAGPGTPDGKGVLVITGMHRSGTSLVASLLEKGGLHLGENLLPADQGNPRGYFEDVEFYKFHSEALENRRQPLSVAEDFIFEPTASERCRAQAMIAGRRHRRLWGWKDPRTALFLDFWNEQLPDARFLFLFRHPLDVLLSLVRRGDVNCLGLTEGLDAWSRYNERILRFFTDHRERSLLCHVRSVLENAESFAARLRDHLGFATDECHLEAVYHPKELRHVELPTEMANAFRSLHPSVALLYDRLNELADLRFMGTPKRRQRTGGFGAWVEELETQQSPGLRRGLTAALIGLVEPDSLENLCRNFTAYQLERDRGVAWLKERVEGMEALVKRSAESNEKLRAWTEELERGRDWLEEQRRSLETKLDQERESLKEQLDEQHRRRELELEERQRVHAGLESWIQELERGRDWLLEQRTHFEEDQRRRTEQNEELRRWVAELERGRDWLQEQWTHSRMEIQQYRGQNEELRAWTMELERGRDWLEEQRRSLETKLEQQRSSLEGQLAEERCRLEAELERRQQGYAELESWARELERGRDWLLEQRTNFEEDQRRRASQTEELREWALELERGRDWLQQQRSNLHAALTRSVAEARALAEQTAERQERIEELRTQDHARELALRRLLDEKSAAERRAVELSGEVERLSTRLASIEGSLSWRSIAALRRLRFRVPGGPSWKPKT